MSTFYAYNNILRTMTFLEKSLDRLARANYFGRSQYPDVLLELESAISNLRRWIEYYRKYDRLRNFYTLLAQFIEELGAIINQLWSILKPVPGKMTESKANKTDQQNKISEKIKSMLTNINTFLDTIKAKANSIATKLDEALVEFFE